MINLCLFDALQKKQVLQQMRLFFYKYKENVAPHLP